MAEKLTNKKRGSHNYYKARFKNVSTYDIRSVYYKSRWILITLDRNLADTRKIYTDFFRFAVAILLKMGKEKTLESIYSGERLYNFIIENGNKNVGYNKE